ncbi:hypothetical protein FBY14_102266 [Azospirillum brasilense]|nr:hypothetical protein FBY14_102266 [Azospirillum brasilense]
MPQFAIRTLARSLAVLCALVALSGCVHYALIPSTEKVTVRSGMTIQPGIEWNRITALGAADTGNLDFWTVDGEQLDLLILAAGIEDGKPLFNITGSNEKPPAYRAGMPTEDLSSLFEAAFTKTFKAKVFTVRSLKPQTVAGGEGIRLDFSFSGEDELDRDGVAVLVQKNGKLYMVAHQGARLHYRPKYAPEVDRIIASMRIIDKA